ncbi:MAG TPA: RagB/SusD family nutrient uptake outer membrane protein, partial [Chitinophaga sp.]|nr:RagB/SusD family nutrient uptake outer membrane protein [Chitinophaga sp.]
STSDFYKTAEDFNLALNGAYATVRDIYNSKSAWIMGEMRSDNTHYDYKPSDQALAVIQRYDVADFIDDRFNTQTAEKWYTCFAAISKVNGILDQIDAITFDAAEKKRIKGEAQFLRALSYFELVRYYGGVPVYTHAVQNREETYLARSTAEEVYTLIISDAKAAVDQLDAPAAFPQTGRVTKGAALTLLGDVYMTLERFPEAEPLLKQVVQMGYGLYPGYPDVFALNNKNGIESVFEIQFNANLPTPQASNFIYNFIPRMANSAVITGPGQNTITNLGGFNTPAQDLLDSYEPGDKRLAGSLAVAEGTFNGTDDFTASAVKPIVGYTPAPGKVGRPFTTKFLHAHTIANQTNDNWPVYRYAEVLLLLAESLNEQGKGGEALLYLNQVRSRAGLQAATETEKEALATIILHERRVELAFENKRWLDLVRTGNALSVMNAFGVKQKQRYSYLLPASYNVTKERLLFPIPNAEVLLNVKLQQNPGYEN